LGFILFDDRSQTDDLLQFVAVNLGGTDELAQMSVLDELPTPGDYSPTQPGGTIQFKAR